MGVYPLIKKPIRKSVLEREWVYNCGRLQFMNGLSGNQLMEVSESSARNGSWFRCADGWPLEPLDALHLLFPNRGRDSVGENVCYVPKPFHFPSLLALLPEQGDLFLPEELVDAVVALVLMCALVTVGLIVAKHAWDYLDPNFRSIYPSHKKWYVVANLSKALFLGILGFSSRYWISAYRCHYQDNFQLIELKRSAVIYIATDVVALYMVPKLPFSTIVHHVATAVLTVVVSGVNLKVKGYTGLLGMCKMTMLYGIFSTIPFLVNAYLALRVVYSKEKWLKVLCKLSLATYVVCCGLNWTVQGLWIMGFWWERDFSVYMLLYVGMLVMIGHDDIVLIRWLLRQSSPMAEHDKHKKL